MSSKLASLKVKITANGAQATKELKSVEKKAKDVAKSMKKIGSALTKYVTGPLVALAAVSVKTADTQMQAEAKLLNALKGREDVQKRLIAQAAELQGRSLFGDEEIINQQAVLAAMGRTEQQINDIIEASAQLSAATGMSLDSAVKNLAKTYAGLTGELGESIPALRELTKEQLMNGDAVKLIKEQYQGFAESAAQAGAGPLVQLKNQLGDLSEQIGMILMPFVKSLVVALSKLVGWLQGLSPAAQKTIVAIAGIAAVVGPLIISLGLMAQGWAAIVAMAPTISAAFTAMTGPIGAVIAAVSTLIVMLSNALTLRDRLQREQQQKRTADQNERRAIIVSNANKEAAWMTDKQLEQAIADTTKEWADLKKAVGDKPSAYQVDALNGLHWRREALDDELARRKFIAQNLKVTGGYGVGVGGGVGVGVGGGVGTIAEIEEATGLIGQLQARVKALNEELGNATSEADIARINAELEVTNKELSRLKNLKPVSKMEPIGALGADGLASGLNPPKFENKWLLWTEFNNNLEEEVERTIELGRAFDEALGSAMRGMVTTIGESLGDLMSMPAEGMENPIKGILTVLGNALKSLGAALITYSGIVEAVKKALSKLWTAGPGGIAAAIGIAIGAIAGGQALLNKAAKLPKLASGGLAYAPTLAMVGDNPGAASDPEVIAPLSKLRSYMGGQQLQLVGNVAFELHGDVARAVLNRENIRLSRLG
jgi:phage-related minor tail protein